MDISKNFLKNNLIFFSKTKGSIILDEKILNIYYKFQKIIRNFFKKNKFKEFSFPILGKKKELEKKFEFTRNFSKQVFFSDSFFLRPTSETIIYSSIRSKINTNPDFKKIFQFGKVFRKETNQNRPFLRLNEFFFFEAHTTTKKSEKEKIFKIYERFIDFFFNLFGLKKNIFLRPKWDIFPGAIETKAVDLCINKKLIQVLSYHDYENNFSKIFNLKNQFGEYYYQTTLGLSERLYGCILYFCFYDNYFLYLNPILRKEKGVFLSEEKKDKKYTNFYFCSNFNNKFYKRINNFRKKGYNHFFFKKKKKFYLFSFFPFNKKIKKIFSKLTDLSRYIDSIKKKEINFSKELIKFNQSKEEIISFIYLCFNCALKKNMNSYLFSNFNNCEICNKRINIKWVNLKKI